MEIEDFVVLPDMGPPDQPRIKCGGTISNQPAACSVFQVAQIPPIGPPGTFPRPVQPNGFSIVGLPTLTYPNGQETLVPNATGIPWPPSWWPSIAAQSPFFQIGVPTVPPPWEEPGEPEEAGLMGVTGHMPTPHDAAGAARRPPPPRPRPKK
jgi:hypothetical protein